MKGSCLCGAVSITAPERTDITACHCSMCRRWGGGPALAFSAGADVSFEGEDNIVRYKSSDWAERGFCGTCGSHLFYFFQGTGDYYLYPGTFDNESGFELKEQIFIDNKPGGYSFANETKDMTEAEFVAQFAPPE